MSGIQLLPPVNLAVNSPPKVVPLVMASGVYSSSMELAGLNDYAPLTLSGACTADTYKTILSINGPGVLNLVAMHQTTVTSAQTFTTRIVIDGVEIMVDVFTTSNTAGRGHNMIGGAILGGTQIVQDQIPFNMSLLIEHKESVTQTDKAAFRIKYRTT